PVGWVVLLPASFAILLAGALLFTNAIEWFGTKVGLGQGAVGSVLAAVATALPESLIPIVAIIEGRPGSDDVATGAILGAPLLLATVAMVLVGVSALVYRERRSQGLQLKAHFPTLERDLGFFMGCFLVALLLGLGAPKPLQIGGAVLLVVAYVGYVRWTLRHSGTVGAEEELRPLILDMTRGDPPGMPTVVVQLVVALAAIVGGAELFVEHVLEVAHIFGLEPLVLSLVVAPFATELPEKANSFFWVRDGKDALALGNITGAMVFQSTLPVTIGLAFTAWELDGYAILAGGLALAGGVVAIITLQIRRRFSGRAIALWTILYAIFVGYVALTG
ncbi:MAG TPA: sodium:calcium antiporter, partial [Actinomycetota bacterium]|nr:sodium:calcium antiporter [Actinomycetota bacterium]